MFPILSATCFGVVTILRKLGLSSMSPVPGFAVNVTTALVAFTAFLVVSGNRGAVALTGRSLAYFVAAGVAENAGVFLGLLALSLGTVSVVAPLAGTAPIFVRLMSFFFLRGVERQTAHVVVGTLLIVLGVYLAPPCRGYNRDMDPAAIETALSGFFSRAPRGIAAAYLFGSVARGTPHAGSDVDVAVLFETDPPPTVDGLPCRLEDELAATVGAPVQVVVLNRAPVDLVHRVLRDGRLLFNGNPSRRIRFEVRARNEFFDLDPFLRRYRAPRVPVR